MNEYYWKVVMEALELIMVGSERREKKGVNPGMAEHTLKKRRVGNIFEEKNQNQNQKRSKTNPGPVFRTQTGGENRAVGFHCTSCLIQVTRPKFYCTRL